MGLDIDIKKISMDLDEQVIQDRAYFKNNYLLYAAILNIDGKSNLIGHWPDTYETYLSKQRLKEAISIISQWQVFMRDGTIKKYEDIVNILYPAIEKDDSNSNYYIFIN